MRARRVAMVAAAAGLLAVAAIPESSLFPPPAGAGSAAGDLWACPMICVRIPRPSDGRCPRCGMDMARMSDGDLLPEQRRRMGIEVQELRAATVAVAIHAAGTAAYDDRQTRIVTARVGGRIIRRHEATYGCCAEVAEGAAVIDLLSPEAYAAQLDYAAALRGGAQAATQARALRARFARWGLSHVAEAIDGGAAPEEVVQIRSEFAGQAWLESASMVDETLMVGREIAPGEPLLRIVDADRMMVSVHVNETRARFLAEGQRVTLTSEDRTALPVQARISRVGNEIDPELRAVEVRIYISAARGVLRAGALVRARIEAVLGADLAPLTPDSAGGPGRHLLVPRDAVLSTGVREVVWVLDRTQPDGSQRFRLAPVALGPRVESGDGRDAYLVRAGLAEGDVVAVRGAYLIDAQAELAGSPSLLHPPGR